MCTPLPLQRVHAIRCRSLRELVISVGHTGRVALFEIVDGRTVVVAAVRHQREDDYS